MGGDLKPESLYLNEKMYQQGMKEMGRNGLSKYVSTISDGLRELVSGSLNLRERRCIIRE